MTSIEFFIAKSLYMEQPRVFRWRKKNYIRGIFLIKRTISLVIGYITSKFPSISAYPVTIARYLINQVSDTLLRLGVFDVILKTNKNNMIIHYCFTNNCFIIRVSLSYFVNKKLIFPILHFPSYWLKWSTKNQKIWLKICNHFFYLKKLIKWT